MSKTIDAEKVIHWTIKELDGELVSKTFHYKDGSSVSFDAQEWEEYLESQPKE